MYIDRINEFEEILEELVNELPQGLLETLNGGIIIEEDIMYHPESKEDDLICLGAYMRNMLGYSIIMYYGSFMEMFWDLPHEEFKEKIRQTLYHEFTHHIEFLSGEKDLEVSDNKYLKKYKERK